MKWPAVVLFLFASTVRAQVTEPPTIAILGHVENGRVAWRKDMTLLELVLDARPRPDAAMTAVTLLRTTGLDVLVLDVDVREMLRTGNTTANVVIREGDLLVVPTKELVAAGKEKGDAVPALLAAIDESTLVAAQRARILGWRLETGKDGRQRQQIVAELGKLGRDAADAVPQLVHALASEPLVAREAATALGMIGAPAKPALPAITRLFEHTDKPLRERARAADRQIRAAIRAVETPRAK